MIYFDYGSSLGHQQLHRFAQRAFSTFQGIQHTYILAGQALAVPGVLVECGVAHGSNAAAMLQAAVDAGQDRELHLFDSYEGIPLAGPKDESQPGLLELIASCDLPLEERLKSSGVSVSTIDQVKAHFTEWNLPLKNVHFHKGWFQHTLPDNTLGPIAMLRLDGDLYESTKCCLDWLYKKVVPGGIVLVDDWNLVGARQAVFDFFAENSGQIIPPMEMPVTVDTGACYWLVP